MAEHWTEEFVVPLAGEPIFAVVELDFPSKPPSRKEVLAKFAKAVYVWASTDGQELLAFNAGVINVGDLASLGEEDFAKFIDACSLQGIEAVRIQTFTDGDPIGWDHDDNLYRIGAEGEEGD